MQDRPVIFSADMVRATFAGRQTQFRRVIKDYPWTRQPYYFCGMRNGLGYPASEETVWAGFTCEGYHSPCYVKCPYGRPGDHLWVRETWIPTTDNKRVADYRATSDGREYVVPWKPSIHMPRWASRLTLEVTDIRVERLQDISEADAQAEGLASWPSEKEPVTHYGLTVADVWETDPRLTYKRLWDSINAKRGYSWESNPWVWVVEFAVV